MPLTAPEPIVQKVELRFRKDESVRFLSHHDLMRAFRRALRRAAVPVRRTAGFNPRPRMVLPLPVETGTITENEILQVELARRKPVADIIHGLNGVLPKGLLIIGGINIPPVKKAGKLLKTVYILRLAGDDPAIARRRLENVSTPADWRRETEGELTGLCLEGKELILEFDLGRTNRFRPLEVVARILERPSRTLAGLKIRRVAVEIAYPHHSR